VYESEHDEAYWEQRTAELTEQVAEEDQKWRQLQFHPGMININAQLMQMKVNTLIQLVKRLGISDAEIEATFKECVLEQLKSDRKMLMQAQAQAQRPDIQVAKKNLLGPNGQPMI